VKPRAPASASAPLGASSSHPPDSSSNATHQAPASPNDSGSSYALPSVDDDATRLSTLTAVVIWLAVQTAVLLLIAADVHWSARGPSSRAMPIIVMAVAQVAASSLLFPVIARSWVRVGLSVVTSWMMLALASGLGRSMDWLLLGVTGLWIGCWLALLSPPACFARGTLARFSSSIIALTTLGGPFLIYFAREFSEGRGIRWMQALPLPAIVEVAASGRLDVATCASLTGLLALDMGLVIMHLRSIRRT